MRACCQCTCPLERGVEVTVVGGPKIGLFCNCCTEMLLAVLRSGWMCKAQTEYIDELEARKRLKSGADYFG